MPIDVFAPKMQTAPSEKKFRQLFKGYEVTSLGRLIDNEENQWIHCRLEAPDGYSYVEIEIDTISAGKETEKLIGILGNLKKGEIL